MKRMGPRGTPSGTGNVPRNGTPPGILHKNKEFSIVIEHVRLLFIPSLDISFDIYPCPFCANKVAKRRELFFER
jgi:hypothetical protein